MRKTKKILIPVEFSDNADAFFVQALDIAKNYEGASITVLHVNEPILSPEIHASIVPETPTISCSYFNERLKQLVDKHTLANGPPFDCRCILGPPSRIILDVAEEESFDLIVMSTHGYKGLKHWLLGSVTEKVVREAICPVITFRPTMKVKQEKAAKEDKPAGLSLKDLSVII